MKKPTVAFRNIAKAPKKQSGIAVTFYATIRDVQSPNLGRIDGCNLHDIFKVFFRLSK